MIIGDLSESGVESGLMSLRELITKGVVSGQACQPIRKSFTVCSQATPLLQNDFVLSMKSVRIFPVHPSN
jgi:hypothetical protein